MQIFKAERKQVKLRLNVASPSGFGKTYGSLLIAYGLTGEWEKICVVDTENNSCSLYSHLGSFNTVSLTPPFTPARYIEAITLCEKAGIEVIIIDSITHVWKGQGGILEYQNSLGGKFSDWAKATSLYQKWLSTILQSKCHIITTNRKKQGYNMITEGNKTKVEKAGMDDEIRDGYEYEMTVALEIINDKHLAKASKDRTGLFADKPEFVITVETGKKILDWCNQGLPAIPKDDEFVKSINACTTYNQLLSLYVNNPDKQTTHISHFNRRKQEVTPKPTETNLSTNNFSSNGTTTVKQ